MSFTLPRCPKIIRSSGKMNRRVDRRWRRLQFEVLEERCVFAGNVTAGVYIEDFTDDLDPNLAGFDRSMAFQHTFENNGQTHVITDPRDTSGPGRNYEIARYMNPPNDDLLLYTGVDRITFPNLMPGVHVAFARVDLTLASGDGQVEFVGVNGTVSTSFVAGDAGRTATVGEEHVLPNGQQIGPIQQVILHGQEVFYADVRILIVPSEGPQALDDFVGTPPGDAVTFDVLENDAG